MPDEHRPKRLLFVQTQAEMAGAQEISRLLGTELSRTDKGHSAFDVHHLFLYRKSAGCDDFPNVHFAADSAPKGLMAALRFAFNTVRIIRQIRPDVLLPFQHYGNIVAAPIGRLLRVKRIIANHVSAPATISPKVRLIDRWLGLAGFYDVMTVNSKQTLQDYADYPDRYKRRIVYVPHGFADKTCTMPKAAARSSFSLPVNAPLIGTVARLHPLKQIDLAIGILSRLPHVHLAVAGQGPDAERLKTIALELGVAERLHMVGEISPGDIGRFLACLDVFVFPSAAETFGLAAVEAAQAGIPVVINGLPVLREVLQVDGNPCALFVNASDPAEFAAGVQELLTDPIRHEALSKQGRRLSSIYSLDAMVNHYRELVLDLSQGHAP
ncbi:glycosyltransferase family 4 protein [Rhizobium sp. FY34]|uniref:glycosyltransferase family 4 protein n=1 Tax=Rhizobium sp. FY34 TaxID=2562309 RepID=UPI0010C0B274|nr:glycosyltransferase family 4 protein [Rhizobium sp. FY34]